MGQEDPEALIVHCGPQGGGIGHHMSGSMHLDRLESSWLVSPLHRTGLTGERGSWMSCPSPDHNLIPWLGAAGRQPSPVELWKGCRSCLMGITWASVCSHPIQEASAHTQTHRPHSGTRGAGSSSHSPVTCRCVSAYTLYTGVLGRVG